ncbi:PQQ-dependent sugar dehydrogenase [Salinibacterium soli]|uniref:PQQ-dependent sugar dehydrogenase n=1 Tax=Antiquaquibacter soli TaxID=3064523 RepID=A0ABT9BP99_9MICO|nr:PQQ-dependent sugar dehydrogenase [Protaetiibacter sp. WY-16]MDO7882830.1 PQQ-dependent sugar dehydrogenase [Protaetiibacter sp. WY-16]
MRRSTVTAGLLLASGFALAGCAAAPAPTPTPSASSPSPSPTPTVDPASLGPVMPTGGVGTITEGLDVPWSIVPLASGSTLISERDRGVVRELTPSGALRDVAVVPDVVAAGEGGLLGIEVVDSFLYAYLTTATDNRIVKFELLGNAFDGYSLGAGTDILTGIAKAGNHNGGRIKVGPDGMLYATVGDASVPSLAQDPSSLNGKILRMTLDGDVPDDNPFPGSLVYSLGHRNPQGIAWDDEGRLWAAEFGQDTWDELNLIEPGANYGWPVVEGVGGVAGYTDPVAQWPTDDASPSGLAYYRGTLFLAGLGGERVWSIVPSTGVIQEHFTEQFGRIRDIVPGPDGSLWFATNNTDGRGTMRAGDDRILQFDVAPVG